MANNLDGIKKLNSEEIKKNRKIVLDYIGDNGSASTNKSATPVFNKIDGIKPNGFFNSKLKAKSKLDKPISKKDNQVDKQQKINSGKKSIEQEKIVREELLKEEISEQTRRASEKRLKAEVEASQQEKLKLAEKIKEEKKIKKEKIFLEEIKKEEEIKKIKQEVKLSEREAAARRRAKRWKAMVFFINNLNNKINNLFSVVRKNLFYWSLYLIIFLVIVYLVICSLVLRSKNNNVIINELGRVLPIPAVITNQGIINNNDFNIIKNNDDSSFNSVDKKNSLVRWLVLKSLNKKYGLISNSFDKVLVSAFIRDEDYNKVGLSRIKKISELLKNVDDLELLSKYADEYNEVIYYNSNEVIKKFGSVILSLNSNQISNIIFRDDGYYIVQMTNNQVDKFEMKYLFVGAKTLDQYINERVINIKFFILAN